MGCQLQRTGKSSRVKAFVFVHKLCTWNQLLFPPSPGRGIQQNFIRGGSTPRSNPLPFMYHFRQKRYFFPRAIMALVLSCTFYWQMVPLSHTSLERSTVMIDFPTPLIYFQSTSDIPTLPYAWISKKVPLSCGASLCNPLLGVPGDIHTLSGDVIAFYKITKTVRELWLAEWSVCMRVCKHGCDIKMFCFLRANRTSMNLKSFWVENSTSLLIYPFPHWLKLRKSLQTCCVNFFSLKLTF